MSQEFVDNVYDSTFEVQTTMANVEKNFAALKSSFSGADAPSDPIAGMWWFDTTANILKLRNEANNAWQSVWNFANNKPILANILVGDIPAAMKDPAAATAGLRTLGTGATQAAAGNQQMTPFNASVTPAKIADMGVSNTLIISSDGERSHNTQVYAKLKEIRIGLSGTYRIKFGLKEVSTGAYGGYGKIYRNGAAVGTQQTGGDEHYATQSEDIAGWSVGDLCQVYVRTMAASGTVYVNNFRVYGTAFGGWQAIA